ncbi:MAG: tetratricopeptide repeat protein [Terriglobia bacterium]
MSARTGGFEATPQGVDELALARRLARCGENARAAARFREYLRVSPRAAAVWYELGESLSRAGERSEAAEAFQKMLDLAPGSAGGEVGLAHAEARLGSYAAALSDYNRALQQSPGNYDALQGKAFALYWTHHFREAQEIFEQLERANPADAENDQALHSIARALDAKRWSAMRPAATAPPQAWLGYEISYLADHPGDAAAIKRLASAEAQLGMYSRAVRNDQRALRVNPADSSAQQHLALELSWSHQYDASIEAYDELLRKHPNDGAALEGLVRVDQWSGRLKDALSAEQRLVDVDSGNFKHQQNVVRLELALKEDAQVRRMLTALIRQRPDDPWALVEMARLELAEGHLPDALTYYDLVLASDLNNPDALYGEARIYYFLDNPDRAYSFAARLLSERPKDFDALLLCARIERARRRRGAAFALLRRAALLSPANAAVEGLEAALRSDRPVTVHTSSTYAREIGLLNNNGFGAPITIEDLNSYSSAVRVGFIALPRTNSYVSLAITPSNSPLGGMQPVSPAELMYGQATRLSRLLTLRGGFGLARLGTGAALAFTAPVGLLNTPSIVPAAYLGASILPARGLSLNFLISRAPITYTPASVLFGAAEMHTEAGVAYDLGSRTHVAASYYYNRDSSAIYHAAFQFPHFQQHGHDHGVGGRAVFDRNLIHAERFSLDAGYSWLGFGYAGAQYGTWMGFFNPEFYQQHFFTARVEGPIWGPFRYSFEADVGAQQAESNQPFTLGSQFHPQLSVRLNHRVTVTLEYVHYDFSQAIGSVRGNAAEIETDWRF